MCKQDLMSVAYQATRDIVDCLVEVILMSFILKSMDARLIAATSLITAPDCSDKRVQIHVIQVKHKMKRQAGKAWV